SGYAIPTYVVDAPGGGGKIPVGPQYLISQAPGKSVLRNYEGFITTYAEPETYAKHDPATCPACQARAHAEHGQQGVAGLLHRDEMTIEPAGFHETHLRGRAEEADLLAANVIQFARQRAEHY